MSEGLGAQCNKLVECVQDVRFKVLGEEECAEGLAVPLHLGVVLRGGRGEGRETVMNKQSWINIHEINIHGINTHGIYCIK